MSDFNNNDNNLEPSKEEFDLKEFITEKLEKDTADEILPDEPTPETTVEAAVTEALIEAEDAINWKQELFEWVQSIAIALIVAFVINTFFFSVVRVDGKSMEDTLHSNDRLIVSKFMYEPEFQDIVIVRPEGNKDRYLVKRVIGMPGDVIDMDDENVYVNGEKLEEPYILPVDRLCGDLEYPVTVKEDYIFVMGDNRGNSLDSRFSSVSQIPLDNVYGKAVCRIWPFADFGGLYGDLK